MDRIKFCTLVELYKIRVVYFSTSILCYFILASQYDTILYNYIMYANMIQTGRHFPEL